MNFNDLGLTESLLSAVRESGYTIPTPIQAKTIPAILNGRDVMAAAQTGTGKTAGFTLPILQLLGNGHRAASGRPRTLILTPTRELAAQILDSIQTYGRNERLTAGVVFGGVNINPQLKLLKRGVDVLVATPGRLLDLHQQRAVNFDAIEIAVLDEADRMLDMGFIHDIKRILKLLPRQRQNLMFSATFSPQIRDLARTLCHDPLEIDVAPRNSTVELISQGLYRVEKQDKVALLSRLLSETTEQVLVFSRTKHGANKLVKCLQKDQISADAIHGNKSQAQRTRVLSDFKSNRLQVLVATDIAARGLDIDELGLVVNFELPHVPEDYVHRIGRTGRAGATGKAVSLVSNEEIKQLRAIEQLIRKPIERLQASGAPARPDQSIREESHRADSRGADSRGADSRGADSHRADSHRADSRGEVPLRVVAQQARTENPTPRKRRRSRRSRNADPQRQQLSTRNSDTGASSTASTATQAQKTTWNGWKAIKSRFAS